MNIFNTLYSLYFSTPPFDDNPQIANLTLNI
jgi:hypothetical protein